MLSSKVGSALVSEFKVQVQLKVEKGDASKDSKLSKTLEGLSLASRHAAESILSQLLSWRQDALQMASGRSPNHAVLMRSKLIIETLFLEAARNVVANNNEMIPSNISGELEQLAFDWILNSDRYVDVVRLQDQLLPTLKDKVVLSASKMLGELSYTTLNSILERFLQELDSRLSADASSPARQEIYDLCHALRFLKLRDTSASSLTASINFLEAVFPLKHVAHEKKSRAQHALCDLLASILSPLSDNGNPGSFGDSCDHAIRNQWFSTVELLRTELFKWTSRQAKQAMAGYPIVTILTCIDTENALVNNIDALIDQLNKQLKEKKNSSMALLCISRCVSCFLRRLQGRSDPERLAKWVARSTQLSISLAIKGSLAMPEQIIVLKYLCISIASVLPEYVFQGILLEMMSLESGHCWEAPFIAVSSLVPILSKAPGKLFDEHQDEVENLPPTPAALEALVQSLGPGNPYGRPVPSLALQRMEHLLLQEYSLFDILEVGHISDTFADALDKIRVQCHQLHGYSTITNSAARYQGDWGKDRVSALSVLISLLDSLPFCIPQGWKTETGASIAFMEDVPGYTIHAEIGVRNAAVSALSRCMRAWPGSRNAIIEGMCRVIQSIIFGQKDLIEESGSLVLRLMRLWEVTVTKETDESSPWSSRGHGTLDSICSVESCGFYLMCHENDGIRSLGLEMLISANRLQRRIEEKAHSHKTLDSNNSKLSSIGSKGFERVVERSEMNVGIEHARIPSQPWIQTPASSISFDRTYNPSEQSVDRFRKSFSDMISPKSNTFSLPWQRTISSTVRGEPVNSAPCSPAEDASVDQRGLIEIISEFGDQICRSCYWDFGPYSSIAKTWKPIPEGACFRSCLAYGRTAEGKDRWFRILAELMRYFWTYAKDSAVCILLIALENFPKYLVTDQMGRRHLSPESSKIFWSCIYMFLIAPTPSCIQISQNDIAERKIADYIPVIINSARLGNEEAIVALGCVDESFQAHVVQKSQVLEKEYTLSAGEKKGGILKSSKETKKDARLVHAQILSGIAANFSPGCLTSEVGMRDVFISFIVDTSRYIATISDISSETQQLRYCLCLISRQVALQLSEKHSQYFAPMLRKQLFNKFSTYTEEGQTPGLFRSELRRHIGAAKTAVRPRDPDRIKEVEREITVSSEMLEHAANLSMGSMLLGPVFDSDSKDPHGRALTWIQRLLESPNNEHYLEWAPKKFEIAREALHFLLSSNLDMGRVFTDQCYSTSTQVSNAYFLVLADVVMHANIRVDAQTLIALVLSKMVESDPESRSKATKLLHTIERRFVPDQKMEKPEYKLGILEESYAEPEMVQDLVVVGGLQNSHTIFQKKVSAAMAMHYEKLSYEVTLEILSRQVPLFVLPDRVQQTLNCLPPWLEQANFSLESWYNFVLDPLYNISKIDGLIQTSTIQEIWRTVASQRVNVIPVLNFLLAKLLEDSCKFDVFDTHYHSSVESGKHIALYLSRVAPKYTIEHLITLAESEAFHSTNEPLDVVESTNAVELGLIKEFHHKAAYAPQQQPLPLQQPLAARAAAAIAAETADVSKPFTASSFAQAIKKSTVDIILKTGVAVADTVVVAGAAAVGTISASGLVSTDDNQKLLRSKARYGEYLEDMQESSSRMDALRGRHSKLDMRENSEPPVPSISRKRTALSSQEGSLCLLSEIVSENDEFLRPHLAELLHIAVLQLDSCNELACFEASQMLQFLLYNLSFKILETNSKENNVAVYSSEYARVAGVIGFLQSVPKGERIWDWELPTLSHPWIASAGSVAAFVQIVANCFPFDSGLSEKWASEALKWACCSRTRHRASRSHQIYCSLSPSLTSPACTALIFCLEKCLRNASSDGLDTGVEILCTLRVLLSNTEREKVILYPHLFAACISLLNSSVVRVGELAIAMLLELLDCLDFEDLSVQQAILSVFCPSQELLLDIHAATSPENKWILGKSLLEEADHTDEDVGGPCLAFQQLLVKGLFQPDTESLSLRAFGSICRQISKSHKSKVLKSTLDNANRNMEYFTVNNYFQAPTLGGIESIFGDISIGLAITISASLPWIFVKVNVDKFSDEVSGFLRDLAQACACVGWNDLGAMLLCLETDPNSKMDIDMSCRNWSKEVVPVIVKDLFPEYGLLFIQRIVETAQRAPAEYQRASLYILEAVFGSPNLCIGSDDQLLNETSLVDTLALELNGELGSCVVKVLEALSAYRGSTESLPVVSYSWRNCIDEIGECNKICARALKRVAMNCPGTAELLRLLPHESQDSISSKSSHLLPFLPE